MTRQGWKHSLRRPRMEKLEDRRLLAVAAFQSELRSDDGGIPGEVLVGPVFQSGETFFLQITAQEFASFLAGIGTAAVDVSWDAGILEVVEEDFSLASVVTPNLPIFRTGILNNAAGTIENLGGSALISFGGGRAIGNRGPETLATIRMRVIESEGQASIKLSESESPTVTVPAMSLKGAQLRFDEELVLVASQGRELSEGEPSSSVGVVDEQFDSAEVAEIVTPVTSETEESIEEMVPNAEAFLPAVETAVDLDEQSSEVVESEAVAAATLALVAPTAVAATTSMLLSPAPTTEAKEPDFGYVCVPADHPQAAGLDSSLTISASSWFADQEERFRRRSLFKPHSN